MLNKILFIFFFFVAATPAVAVTVPAISASADKNQITIGDPVTLTITLSLPNDCRAVPPAPASSFGPWEVKDSTAAQTATPDGTLTRLIYSLTTYATGQQLIPPLAFTYTDGHNAATAIKTTPVPVTVQSVLAGMGTGNDIRDIKPPVTMPLPLWIYLAWLAAGIALAAGGYLWYTGYRRRAEAASPVPDVPPVPPYQLATERLATLKNSTLITDGKIKEYYSELADIVREYLGAVYAIDTREKTSAEIYARLRTAEPDKKKLLPLREFFDACDLVKFAKYRPDETVCRTDWEAANTIVENY
jgi:hypothetical protein